MELIQAIDDIIMMYINDIRGIPLLDTIMKWISFLGNNGFIYIVIGVAMVLCIKKYPKVGRWGLVLLISLLISTIIVNLFIKPYVARIRPFDRLMLDVIIEKPKDFSFPSGHTTAGFGTAIVFMYINKKLGILALMFAVLMGISRMYLMVHFPTDVIVGAIIGSITSVVICEIYTLICMRKRKRTS